MFEPVSPLKMICGEEKKFFVFAIVANLVMLVLAIVAAVTTLRYLGVMA